MDLGPWRDDPARAGVLTDFDGTLAPIVGDPATASAVSGGREALAALVDRLAVVAVVSGRPAAFLAERLGVPGLELVGLYGLERYVDGRVVTDPAAEPYRPALAELARRAVADAPDGVMVEDKGLTVTLHARSRPERMDWIDGFVDATSGDAGLAAHPGKLSVELRPPVAVDKGTALLGLSEGLRAVMYLGDDLGDLPAYAALRRRRSEGCATLGVAVGGRELPAEVGSAADVVLDDPPAAVDLLRRLV